MAAAGLGVALAVWVLLPDGLVRHLDWHVHLCWLQGFHDGLAHGAVYPRWIDGANQGQGGPVFVYYAPLAYYVGSVVMWLGASAAAALDGVYALALFVCAVGLYVWLRGVAGGAGALLLAGFGLLAPQLTMFAYAYNMPASALAVAVLPWVGWALERGGARVLQVVVLAVVLACLLLAHTLTGFQVMLLLAAAGAVAWVMPHWRGAAVRVLLPAAVLACALAAVYLLPLVDQRDLVHAHHLLDAPNWRIASNLQFAWLFGGARAAQGEFAFDIANGAALLLLGVAVWRIRRRSAAPGGDAWIAYACAAVVAFVLMTPLSAWLYAWFEPLRFLQFGWRWQALFLLCVLRVVAEAMRVPARTSPPSAIRSRWWSGSVMVACGAVIVACMVQVTPSLAALVGRGPDVGHVDADEAAHHAARCVWPTLEYRPVAMGEGWRRDLDRLPREPSVLRGRAHVVSADDVGERKIYRIVADVPSRVVFPVLQFPGWVVQHDGRVMPAEALSHDGRIVLDLARGTHDVVLRFEPSRAVVAGRITSALALLVLLAMTVVAWRRTARDERAASMP